MHIAFSIIEHNKKFLQHMTRWVIGITKKARCQKLGMNDEGNEQ